MSARQVRVTARDGAVVAFAVPRGGRHEFYLGEQGIRWAIVRTRWGRVVANVLIDPPEVEPQHLISRTFVAAWAEGNIFPEEWNWIGADDRGEMFARTLDALAEVPDGERVVVRMGPPSDRNHPDIAIASVHFSAEGNAVAVRAEIRSWIELCQNTKNRAKAKTAGGK
ncbi:hypothetical protein [Nocardia fluminea]|uniref:hypothetical protein n=1 Tax=Nocardia fluminea TaxID=134984 RepID=UPI00365DABB3